MDLLSNHKGTVTDKMTGKHSTWIIDTGASNHMTGNLKLLCAVRDIAGCPVGLPNGKHVLATKEGTKILNGGLKIENVLYVPTLSCNLISISQLIDETNCVVHFTNDLCVMQDRTSKMLIGAGERRDGLYYFRNIRNEKAHKASRICQFNLWHQRMRHPSFRITQLVSNIDYESSELNNKACDVCFRAKQTRNVFPLSTHNAVSSFDLIHCDLWGPYRTPSSCGASYFLTIMDDFSRAIWIYLISDKREVSRTLISFFALIERQFDKRVKVMRSDNGTEFTCLKNYFCEHGIVFQTSCPGTPQQNGRVERTHRHIFSMLPVLYDFKVTSQYLSGVSVF
jgi:transposase InsO family protein